MSRRRDQTPSASSGSAATGTGHGPDTPVKTREREVTEESGIPTPLEGFETPERSRIGYPTGPTLAEIAAAADPAGPNAERMGYGPRVVILADGVASQNPATRGTMFTRGQVRWLSDLLGDRMMEDERLVAQEVKRLLDNGAIRQANNEEAKYDLVVFVEGEAALTDVLTQTQAEKARVMAENERLRTMIEGLGHNPDDLDSVFAEAAQAGAASRSPSTGITTPTADQRPGGTADVSTSGVVQGDNIPL